MIIACKKLAHLMIIACKKFDGSYCSQAKYDDFQGPLTIVTYQFTYSATDVFGNTASAVNFTVTVKDLYPPIMIQSYQI